MIIYSWDFVWRRMGWNIYWSVCLFDWCFTVKSAPGGYRSIELFHYGRKGDFSKVSKS
jgi:hypothetical protein